MPLQSLLLSNMLYVVIYFKVLVFLPNRFRESEKKLKNIISSSLKYYTIAVPNLHFTFMLTF